MKALCDVIYQACKWIIVVLGYILVGVIAVGVVERYVFGRPNVWEYEFCIATFVWCMFLGTATCFRDKQQIAFEMVVNILPGASRKAVMFVKNILILIVLALGAYYGTIIAQSTYDIQYQTMPYSLAISYAALPVGFALSFLFFIENLIKDGFSN